MSAPVLLQSTLLAEVAGGAPRLLHAPGRRVHGSLRQPQTSASAPRTIPPAVQENRARAGRRHGRGPERTSDLLPDPLQPRGRRRRALAHTARGGCGGHRQPGPGLRSAFGGLRPNPACRRRGKGGGARPTPAGRARSAASSNRWCGRWKPRAPGASGSSPRLAPCIAQASYEVGEDYGDRFAAEAPGSERFFAAGRPGQAAVRSAGLRPLPASASRRGPSRVDRARHLRGGDAVLPPTAGDSCAASPIMGGCYRRLLWMNDGKALAAHAAPARSRPETRAYPLWGSR